MRHILRYIMLIMALIIYSGSISLILDPNSLAPGGFTGVAIIINHSINIKTGTLILLMNLPILIIAFFKFGKSFCIHTLGAILISSTIINYLSDFEPLTREPILAAIAGGTGLALGLGTILKMGATTGGMDIVVKLLRLRFPHLKTSGIFLILDGIVIAISALVFRNIEVALYASIAVVVSSFVLDLVLYGKDGAKLVYIISNKEEEIGKRILEELNIGVTYLNGSGAYTKSNKRILMCASRKPVSIKIRNIVHEEDDKAFMIITSATEIFGEGFKIFGSNEL